MKRRKSNTAGPTVRNIFAWAGRKRRPFPKSGAGFPHGANPQLTEAARLFQCVSGISLEQIAAKGHPLAPLSSRLESR
jgi:hypothetical protein